MLTGIKKRVIITFTVLVGCLLLSGCSLKPYRPSASKVEKVAKECINQGVQLGNGMPSTQSSGAGIYIWYPMTDERGIDFRVAVDDRYVIVVEPISFLYSKNISYITDYKGSVMDYYRDDIERILKEAGAVTVTIDSAYDGHIVADFSGDTSFEDIADALIRIDDILDFDYEHNGTLSGIVKNDLGALWRSSDNFDILVRMYEDGSSKSANLLYDSFSFSDNHSKQLTHEKILNVLEADRYSRENGNGYTDPLGMVMVNETIYKDAGLMDDNYFSEDDCDGVTEKRVVGVPQNDGESNTGAGMKYIILPEGNLIVFHKDGAHLYIP